MFVLLGLGSAAYAYTQKVGPFEVITVSTVSPAVVKPSPTTTNNQLSLTESSNQKTISVKVGTLVKLVLASTYWTIVGSSDNAILSPTNVKPIYAPSGNCEPGGGCGTVSATFQAVKPSSSIITASRISCGEALACNGTQGDYSVKVVIIN